MGSGHGMSEDPSTMEYDDPMALLKLTQCNFNEHDAHHSDTPHGNSIVVILLRIPGFPSDFHNNQRGFKSDVSTHCPPKSTTHMFPQATYLL